MHHRLIEPSGILKPHIECFVVLESTDRREIVKTTRVFPRGAIDLVFHYGRPFLFACRGAPLEIEPRSAMCGQQTTFYDVRPLEQTGMIFVMFRPHGAGMFFEIPMIEILNQNVSFEEIVRKEAREIEDKVACAASIRDRIRILEFYLIDKLLHGRRESGRIAAALDGLKGRHGRISIKQMAETACLSVRQFERRFSELVGLNPKKYLQVARFQNVLRLRAGGCPGRLASLAGEGGYYDQSHMTHDFKALTGLTPQKFFDQVPRSAVPAGAP